MPLCIKLIQNCKTKVSTFNGKKGKMKGVARTVFTLIIGPHRYKNNRNYKGLYYFYCVDCLKKKKCVSAVAEQVAGEDPEQYTYVLLEAPSIDQHCCEQDGTKAAINKARTVKNCSFPRQVVHVAAKIGELKNLSTSEVLFHNIQNSKCIYKRFYEHIN